MISKLLVNSYAVLSEISLWLFFIGAIVGGFQLKGVMGAIAFVVGAFIISVLFVAPFLLIADIRERVKNIEDIKSKSSTQ